MSAPSPLPRVTIAYCTQCKWLLRAAYFAQELLSTFSTSLGEVALQPSTGGTFTVEIKYECAGEDVETKTQVLWDRKTEGGFPETKELKRRVRDCIDPERDLGHVDGKKVVKEVEAGGEGRKCGAKKEGGEGGRKCGAKKEGAAGGKCGAKKAEEGETAEKEGGKKEECEDCQ